MARTKGGRQAAKKSVGKKKIAVDPIEAEYLSTDDEQIAPSVCGSDSPRRRKTLEEVVAESGEAAAGIFCPRCDCRHLRVISTWDIDGGRRRKRVCRHCGFEFATTEK